MFILRPNVEAVAAKVIDGEAIIMNLTNGAYYSMDRTGAEVWEMIEIGGSVESIGAGIARRYGLDQRLALDDVERLVNELLAEGLIVRAEGKNSTAGTLEHHVSSLTYQAPRLNKYTEMADLLALDPPMPALPSDRPSGE